MQGREILYSAWHGCNQDCCARSDRLLHSCPRRDARRGHRPNTGSFLRCVVRSDPSAATQFHRLGRRRRGVRVRPDRAIGTIATYRQSPHEDLGRRGTRHSRETRFVGLVPTRPRATRRLARSSALAPPTTPSGVCSRPSRQETSAATTSSMTSVESSAERRTTRWLTRVHT